MSRRKLSLWCPAVLLAAGFCVPEVLFAQPADKPAVPPKLSSSAAGAIKRFEQQVASAELTYDKQMADAAGGFLRKLKSMRRQIEQSGDAAEIALYEAWVRQANRHLVSSQLRQGQVADLFELIDLNEDVLEGSLKSDEKGLVAGPGRTILKLPVWGTTAYEIRLQATWSPGASIRLLAPIGGRSVGVDLIRSGSDQATPISGLTLDGEESSAHALARPSNLTALYKHSFETSIQLLPMERVRIAATANRGSYLSWEGELARLNLTSEDLQKPGPMTAAIVLAVPEAGQFTLHGLQVRVVGSLEGGLDESEPGMPSRVSFLQLTQALQKLIENASTARIEAISKAAGSADELLENEQLMGRRAFENPAQVDAVTEARRKLAARVAELGARIPPRQR